MADTYWAIGHDYGCYEGQRPPLTLVATEVEARAVCKLFNEVYQGHTIYCVEVPIWPVIRDAELKKADPVTTAPPAHRSG